MTTAPFPPKIGKYDVLGVIGRGGMGVVYQAMDPNLDRRVAIKMITGAFSENSDMLKRFFREAQSLGSLQHPNIVTVFDLGDFHGNPYFVMEYLEGEGLDSVLSSRRQLNLLEKISIVVQVCNGLGYAHRRGVIHRDIKPANIMINKDGGVKIFDFGIAHAGQTGVTRTGEVLGTLRYMAPEQVNSKGVDSRTDLFATGVVLYQLITDHLPFDGENTAATLMKIVNQPPPPLSDFLSVFPPEIEQILNRSLAKNPDDRYESADEFAFELVQLQGQLKEELIGREMDDVVGLINQGEVYKAQGSLLRVLKIDQQHTKANRLLREVQQRIQRDEIVKQVRNLKERAAEAMADEQFDRALELVDRALMLDRNNAELQQYRQSACVAAEQAEKLQQALKAAEAAQAQGNLDEALQAAETALAVAPNDTHARTTYRLITRDIEELARHQRMEGYLLEAQQEISSRRFTAALMILKQAEALDPAAPLVHSLMESAAVGHEQERRRRELDALAREVEVALNQDDFRTACQRADEGLAKFPDDRNLLKLKKLADRQRQVEGRKQLVDGLMSESRTLLQAGRHEELKDKLERAIAHLGNEPRLESMLGVVRERLHREQMSLAPVRSQQEFPSSSAKTVDFSATQIFPQGENPNTQSIAASAAATAQKPDSSPAAPTTHADSIPLQSTIGFGETAGSPTIGLRRDATISSSVDMPSASYEGASQLGRGSDELNDASLRLIERNLAPFIGPLAKILVKRAAGKTKSLDELYTLLSASVESEEDRKAFLAKRIETASSRAGSPFTKLAPVAAGPPTVASIDGSDPAQVTPAAIELATRKLAPYLGPIAPIVTRKESKRASTLAEFYDLLAGHIVDLTDRERFLKQATQQKDSPASSFPGRDKTGSR